MKNRENWKREGGKRKTGYGWEERMAKKGRNGEVAGKGFGRRSNGSRIEGGKEGKAGMNVIGRCERKKKCA